MTTTVTESRDDAEPTPSNRAPHPATLGPTPPTTPHGPWWDAIVAGLREPATLLPAMTVAVLVVGLHVFGNGSMPDHHPLFGMGILAPLGEHPHTQWAGSSLVVDVVTAMFVVLGTASTVVSILIARRHPWVATALASWPFLGIPLLALPPIGNWASLVVITVLALHLGRRAWAVPLTATIAFGALLPLDRPWAYAQLPMSMVEYIGTQLWLLSALVFAALAAGIALERWLRVSGHALPPRTILVQSTVAAATLWWFCLPLPLKMPIEAWISSNLNAMLDLTPALGWTVGLMGTVSATAAVVLARQRPGLATLLASWPLLSLPVFGVFNFGWLVALVLVATFAGFDAWRRGVPAIAVSLATIAAWLLLDGAAQRGGNYALSLVGPDGPLRAATYAGLAIGTYAVAVAVGIAVRAQRRARAAAAAERRALATESLATERARLARDLHDVVAHHVSLVAVRAESAPFVHPGLNDDAREVLADIATDARSALDELRQVLIVLQRAEGEGPELAPQPGACDIPELVEQARGAGQDVHLEGECDQIPAAPGYVLYRAAQEALTNARRHAPGVRTDVALLHDADVVGLRVTNPTPSDVRPSTLAPGRGLTGMRERAEALGGDVTTTVNGVFTLLVTIPLDGGPR